MNEVPSPAPLRSFRADALQVHVFATGAELARAAALAARDCLQSALAKHGRAAAILASAASQVQFLEVLTALPELDWSRVTLFHMDEYLGVDDQHPASFRRFLRERVLTKIQPAVFHFIRGEAAEPLDECRRYAALLAAQPIDLCCLGIGENGHVAFNDPPVADFADTDAVKLVQLDEACRRQQVGEGAFPNLEAVPQNAYTLTIPTLCAAAKVICVVPEQRKARAVRDALQGPLATSCPASILRRQPHATLFLDPQSGSLL